MTISTSAFFSCIIHVQTSMPLFYHAVHPMLSDYYSISAKPCIEPLCRMRKQDWLNRVLNGLSFLIPSSWFEECTSFIGGPWPWVELPSVTDYYDSLCAILTLCVRLSSGCYVSVVLRVVTYVLLAGVVVGNEVEMRNCLSDEFLDSNPCCVTDTQADVLSSLILTLSVICSFDCSMYCVCVRTSRPTSKH